MAICKQCGKEFHACCSCGLIGHEWDYCTEECWNNSTEKEELYSFISSLNKEQLEYLYKSDFDDELSRTIYLKLNEDKLKEEKPKRVRVTQSIKVRS